MDAKELPNRIQIAYKRVWVGPFRTAGREEKGRVYLVGARRRRRSQRRRRGGRHRSPSHRRRETERGNREREKNGRLPDEEAGWKPSRSGEKGLIRFGRFGFFDNLCANTAVFCVYRVLF
jgi:hypothetical protein